MAFNSTMAPCCSARMFKSGDNDVVALRQARQYRLMLVGFLVVAIVVALFWDKVPKSLKPNATKAGHYSAYPSFMKNRY